MAKETNITLKPYLEVYGKPTGKSLWAVVLIDEEDLEDSQTEIWRADNQEELAELALKRHVGEEIEEGSMAEAIAEEFKNNWGVTILPTRLGKINPAEKK